VRQFMGEFVFSIGIVLAIVLISFGGRRIRK